MDVIFWNDCPPFMEDREVYFLFRYIGPYKLAHQVRSAGYHSQVIDFITELSEEELWELTTKFVTDETVVLGISATFLFTVSKFDESLGRVSRIPGHIYRVLTRFKETYPHIKIILGGYNAEVVSGFGLVDAIVTGFGEDTFLELVNHYKKKTPAPYSKLHAPRKGKNILLNYYQAREKKYDIASDSFLFSKNDCILPNDTLPLEISRGCIFKCKFCRYPLLGRGKLDYLRNMECVRDELVHNYENFGVTNYYILCDTFNDTEYKIGEWHKAVTSLPFKITFSAYIRADLIHRYPDTAYQLKESGLFGAYHGLESLHPDASRLVGKGWNGKHARDFIPELYHNIWKGEVSQTLNAISGLPGEPEESHWSTVDWFIDNKLHHLNFFGLLIEKNPWKHNSSEFERNAAEYGFQFDEHGNWYNGEWNFIRAHQLSLKLNDKLFPHNKSGVWGGQSLMSVGFNKDTILNRKIKDWNWDEEYQPRKAKYLEDYKAMLRAL